MNVFILYYNVSWMFLRVYFSEWVSNIRISSQSQYFYSKFSEHLYMKSVEIVKWTSKEVKKIV